MWASKLTLQVHEDGCGWDRGEQDYWCENMQTLRLQALEETIAETTQVLDKFHWNWKIFGGAFLRL